VSFEKWLGEKKEKVEVVPTDTGKPVTGEKPKSKPAPEVPPGKTEDELRAEARRLEAEIAESESAVEAAPVRVGATVEEHKLGELAEAPQELDIAEKRAALAEVQRGIVEKEKTEVDPVGPPAESPPVDETKQFSAERAPMFAGRSARRADEMLRRAEKGVYTSGRMSPGILDEWLLGEGPESRQVKIQVEGEPEARRYAVSRKREDLKRALGLKGYGASPEKWLTEGWRKPLYGAGRIIAEIVAQAPRIPAQTLMTGYDIYKDATRGPDDPPTKFRLAPSLKDIWPELYANPDAGPMVEGIERDEYLPNPFIGKAHKGGVAFAPRGDVPTPTGKTQLEMIQKAINEQSAIKAGDVSELERLQKQVGKPTLVGSPRLAEEDRRTYANIEVLRDSIERGEAVLAQLYRVKDVTIPATKSGRKAERLGESSSLPLTEEQRDKRDSTQGFGESEDIDPYGESIRDPIIDDDKRERIEALKDAFGKQF